MNSLTLTLFADITAGILFLWWVLTVVSVVQHNNSLAGAWRPQYVKLWCNMAGFLSLAWFFARVFS